MEIGQQIIINGTTYTVLQQIGTGGQGSVWKAKSSTDGLEYALKVISETNQNRRSNKIANIRRLINDKTDSRIANITKSSGVNHVLPIAYFIISETQESGYVMEYVTGRTLNSLLLDGTINKMKIEEKLTILKKIAKAIDVLHTIGYCYTDINWGNFLWNKKSNLLHVIDCENIADTSQINNGRCDFLIGTGFFIAPEVAFGQQKVSYFSDRYALTTLIFRVLLNNVLQSAYHGIAMYSAQPACQNMMEVAEMENEGDIDKNWCHFVFDKENHSNSIDNLCQNCTNQENIDFRGELDKATEIWKSLDDRIKNRFFETFSDPFNQTDRTLASEWVTTIDNVLSGRGTHNFTSANQGCVSAPKPIIQRQNTQQPGEKASPSGKPIKEYPGFGTPHKNASQQMQPSLNSKYKGFRPANNGGHQASQQKLSPSLPQKPYLITNEGIAIQIVGADFEIEGAKFGMSQKTIGHISYDKSDYCFTSKLQSIVDVYDSNDKIKIKLSKEQSIVLSNEDVIKPVISFISIKFIC